MSDRLADIKALYPDCPSGEFGYFDVGGDDFLWLIAEVERLKVERDTYAQAMQIDTLADGMEQAAVIFDGDGSKMVSRAWAAAAIRKEIKP